LLKELPAINKPFPALTSLELSSPQLRNVPVLPGSFLGGSAPHLLSLYLEGIPYPSIGTLLSSTTNLVRLSLRHIPHSGYIAPETIVACLSTLARLESLELGFRYPRSRVHRASRYPPPLTRVVFPNLTFLDLRSDIEYLEDTLSQIETPILNQSGFSFFNQRVFDTPLLRHFIRRTVTFSTIHRARIELFSFAVVVTFCGREVVANNNSVDKDVLRLKIICTPLDWQLYALAQLLYELSSCGSILTSECLDLEIAVSRKDWRGKIEATQWLELLRTFDSVKDMTLEHDYSVRLVATSLRELSGKEMLPDLQNLFLRTAGRQPSRPVKEALEQFMAARQLCGRPVTVHYDDTES